jgi:leader peptidase (prepilin peptidase)/N-methyltransferase
MYSVVAAVFFGLLAGPWLRAAVFRLAVETGAADRVTCPHCGGMLFGDPPRRWGVLSPSGRCPRCRSRIGQPPFLVEAAAGAASGTLAAALGPRPELPAMVFVAVIGLALTVIDVAVHRLPDRLTLPAYPVVVLMLGVAALVDGRWEPLVRALAAGLAAGLCYLALVLLRPDQLGLGDAKLAGVLGIALGWFGWDVLLYGTALAFVACAATGLGLLAARRVTPLTSLPLGPFMVAGAFAVILTAV